MSCAEMVGDRRASPWPCGTASRIDSSNRVLVCKTRQGIQTMTNREAEAVVAKDRESSQRDLYESIEKGDFPKWDFKIQVMPEIEAETYHINPFDLTKVWPHGDYPLIDVGVLELNRNPENYFAEIEQSAFNPSNVVPGISWSPDKMLQARIFSYADAHRYRIGAWYEALPVNRPKCAVNHYHMDGNMRFDQPGGPDYFYEPNSMGGPVDNHKYLEPPLKISGDADRYDHRVGNDDYTQPGNLFRLMSDDQKQQLFNKLGRMGFRACSLPLGRGWNNRSIWQVATVLSIGFLSDTPPDVF